MKWIKMKCIIPYHDYNDYYIYVINWKNGRIIIAIKYEISCI